MDTIKNGLELKFKSKDKTELEDIKERRAVLIHWRTQNRSGAGRRL
jgi:hypothetical protein